MLGEITGNRCADVVGAGGDLNLFARIQPRDDPIIAGNKGRGIAFADIGQQAQEMMRAQRDGFGNGHGEGLPQLRGDGNRWEHRGLLRR